MIDYVKLAVQTDNPDIKVIIERLSNPRTARILHAVMGIVTESGEMMDNLKKHIIYGKPLDIPNLIEELGDSQWYHALLVDELGMSSFNEVQRINIDKLKKRYPDKFTEKDALNRDLIKEREILEGTRKRD